MVSNVWALQEAKLKDVLHIMFQNDQYTFMKEEKIITFTCDGNERLIILRMLIKVLLSALESHTWYRIKIMYKSQLLASHYHLIMPYIIDYLFQLISCACQRSYNHKRIKYLHEMALWRHRFNPRSANINTQSTKQNHYKNAIFQITITVLIQM